MVPHPPLIIPEVGRGQEKKITDTIRSYHKVAEKISRLKPDTVILVSPHQVMYADYFHISPGKSAKGDFGQFRAANVQIEAVYDEEFAEELSRISDKYDIPAGKLGERDQKLDHGTMIPLFFIDQYWKNYRLVRIGLSGLPFSAHYTFGKCIQETVCSLNRNAVFIASGDLSHYLKSDGPYGFHEEGPQYDKKIMDVMERGAFDELLEFSEQFCEKAGECGHRSFMVMAGALDKTAVIPEKLSYEGTFGVGYGVCAYTVCGKDENRDFLAKYQQKEMEQIKGKIKKEDAYVSLARNAVDMYVRTGKRLPVPANLPKEMYEKKAGTFVSIKEEGNLRGCIGTIHAVQTCVAEEIIENAISACSRDPRFLPVKEEELSRISINVDVLGEIEKISSPLELDVKRYGVVVMKGARRGLLLPDLEGIDTIEEQLSIAKRKAGIPEWERAELARFEVVRHF